MNSPVNPRNQLHAIAAIARADFLERVRRHGFLVALIAAIYLGYASATGKILLLLDDYRGIYTAGWIGLMVAVVTTTFVSLVGFYIVKNAVERDHTTRVGQILAATPLSRSAYMLGKLASNFLVLSVIVAVLACGAVLTFFVAAEDSRFDSWALLSPFLLIALPAMAIVAALALLFESLPVLRSGFGNIVWFFVWALGLALPEITTLKSIDPFGVWTTVESLRPAAQAAIPGYKNGMSVTIDPGRQAKIAEHLHWLGIPWTVHSVFYRLLWIAVAIALALLAAAVFNRFDDSGSRLRAPKPSRRTPQVDPVPAVAMPPTRSAAPLHLTPLPKAAPSGAFGRLVIAELRLALQGYRWWWYAVALGLLIAQFVTPLTVSYGPLLAVAWLWPVLIWSAMGARESRFATSALLFSSARILPRQLPACFLAGFLVTAFAGAGAAIRLLLVWQAQSFLAWLVAAAFLPALALALGVLTGSSKFFEALYVTWWYVGPLNHTPGLDFTGSASGPATLRYTMIYLALAAALVFAAFAARARQLRHA